jgi:hypothetical protein
MKPVEFIIFDGGSSPNMAAHRLAEALEKDITILGPDGEYEVLSYYVSNGGQGGRMFLDIQKKGTPR